MNSISGITARPVPVQFGKNYEPGPSPSEDNSPVRPTNLLDRFESVALSDAEEGRNAQPPATSVTDDPLRNNRQEGRQLSPRQNRQPEEARR